MPAINQYPQLKAADGSVNVNFTTAGSGAVTRTLQDKLRETVSVKDFGAVGDGVANDAAALVAAVATGKVVDGGGLTYGVTGTVTLSSSIAGLQNIRIKQLAPTTNQVRTLVIDNASNFFLRDIVVDRGGAPGYTVGTLGASGNWAGIWIGNSSRFILDNVRVTNGGRGTGIVLWINTNFEVIGSGCDEHYWQEVNPAVPVVTDDIIQPFWVNGCSRFTFTACYARNITTGIPGDPTVGVAASQVNRYTRWAFGGNTNFGLANCTSSVIDQGFDFTGSVGNSYFTITNCRAVDCGAVGFKFANSSHHGVVSNCVAEDCGFFGFGVSGMSEVSNPLVRNITFSNCQAVNTGSNGYFATTYGFSIFASPINNTYPRSIRFANCSVVDTQAVPTTDYGFASDVAIVQYSATDYNKNIGNSAVNCSVDAGIANAFGNIGPNICISTGTSTQSIPNTTWTKISWDDDFIDYQGIHNVADNADAFYIKAPGLYRVFARVQFAGNANGRRLLRIHKNNIFVDRTTSIVTASPAANPVSVSTEIILFLNSGDYVDIRGYQETGGELNVDTNESLVMVQKIDG